MWLISIWLIFYINLIINFQHINSTQILIEIFSYLIVIVLLQNYYKDTKPFDFFDGNIFVSLFIFHLAVGIIFYYTRIHTFTNFYYSNKIIGFLYSPVYFTNVLLLLLPFLLLCFIDCKKNKLSKLKKIILLIAIACFIFSIIINKNRTGAIIILISITITIYLNYRKKLLISFLLVFSSIIALVAFYKYTDKTDSTNGRILILNISESILEENPMLGIGFNNFAKNYAEHQKEYFTTKRSTNQILVADDIKFSYNEFLQTAIELGIVGLILLLIAIKNIFIFPAHLNTQQTYLKYYFLLTVCLISLLTNPFRVIDTQITIIAISIFIIVTNNSEIKYAYILNKKLVLFIILYMIINVAYKQYYLLQWKNFIDQTKFKNHSEIFYGDKQLKNNSNYLYYSSAELYLKKDYNNSILQTKKLLQIDNNSKIHLLLGNNYSKIRKSKEAIECFNTASLMNPKLLEPKYLIMNEYLKIGDTVSAKKTALEISKKAIKIRSFKTDLFVNSANKVILLK